MMVLFPLLRKFMSSIRVFYLSFGMAIAGYAILLVLMIGGHTVLGALVVPGFFDFCGIWHADCAYHGISGKYGRLWGNEKSPQG